MRPLSLYRALRALETDTLDLRGHALHGSVDQADLVLAHAAPTAPGAAHVLRGAAYLVRHDFGSAFLEFERAEADGFAIGVIDDAIRALPVVPAYRDAGSGPIRAASWLLTAGRQARAVARVEGGGARFVGTGVLVDGGLFDDAASGVPCLLTCAHVCGGAPGTANGSDPLTIHEARVRFPGFPTGTDTFETTATEAWTSPVDALDASLLRLAARPPAPIEPVQASGLDVIGAETRTYLLAFPGGAELGLSLEQNEVERVRDGRFTHALGARPGSSGGPLFHWGDFGLAGIHRGQVSDAKQATLLDAIRQAAKHHAAVADWHDTERTGEPAE